MENHGNGDKYNYINCHWDVKISLFVTARQVLFFFLGGRGVGVGGGV